MSKAKDIAEQVPFWVPANELLGLGINENMIPYNIKCPFHQDDTPSMRVHKDGKAFCFGCGQMYSSYDVILKYNGGNKKLTYRMAQSDFGVEFTESAEKEEVISNRIISSVVGDVNERVKEGDYDIYKLMSFIHRSLDV